jgi:hypothetical protein
MKIHELLSLADNKGQSDSSVFSGKKYRTQDTKYGHYIGEYDTEEEAKQAALSRPYTRVLSHPDPSKVQENRDKSIEKVIKFNPDMER